MCVPLTGDIMFQMITLTGESSVVKTNAYTEWLYRFVILN